MYFKRRNATCKYTLACECLEHRLEHRSQDRQLSCHIFDVEGDICGFAIIIVAQDQQVTGKRRCVTIQLCDTGKIIGESAIIDNHMMPVINLHEIDQLAADQGAHFCQSIVAVKVNMANGASQRLDKISFDRGHETLRSVEHERRGGTRSHSIRATPNPATLHLCHNRSAHRPPRLAGSIIADILFFF